MIFWEIKRGHFDNTNLSGSRVLGAYSAPQPFMTDGSWQVKIYIDANKHDARESLSKIWSCDMGGNFSAWKKLIANLEVKYNAIKFKRIGEKQTASVSGLLKATIEPFRGAKKKIVEVRNVNNPIFTDARIGKTITNEINEPNMQWCFSGTNGFYSSFRYCGPKA